MFKTVLKIPPSKYEWASLTSDSVMRYLSLTFLFQQNIYYIAMVTKHILYIKYVKGYGINIYIHDKLV